MGSRLRTIIARTAGCSLLAVALISPACTRTAPNPRPNVVLIVLDTTRVDRLSAYGYGRPTTPNLEEFAKHAVRFDRAYSTSTWTLPAHASLFTGLLPTTHQATQENLRLDDELDTLAELLGRDGYETVAFTDNSWISNLTQLAGGFEQLNAMWRDRSRPAGNGLPHPTNTAIGDWLETRSDKRPFLLFINYMEAHWPFNPPAPYWKQVTGSMLGYKAAKPGNFAAIFWYTGGGKRPQPVLDARSNLYDAEIAYSDAIVGELLAMLKDRGILNDALVVITADHGENLGEHGHQGHSFALYDQTLRVPLLIRLPNKPDMPRVRKDPVQLTDVFATILAAAGAKATDPRVVGSDLFGEGLPDERPVIAEYYYPKTFLGRFPKTEQATALTEPYRRRIRSIQVGAEKLIWGSDGRHELYDTEIDPGEMDNLIEQRVERAKFLEERLEETMERLARPITEVMPPISEMDEETIANLRALGYIP